MRFGSAGLVARDRIIAAKRVADIEWIDDRRERGRDRERRGGVIFGAPEARYSEENTRADSTCRFPSLVGHPYS